MAKTQEQRTAEEQAVDTLTEVLMEGLMMKALTPKQQAAYREAARREQEAENTNAARTRRTLIAFARDGVFGTMFDDDKDKVDEVFAKLHAVEAVDLMLIAGDLLAAANTFQVLSQHLMSKAMRKVEAGSAERDV